MNMYKIQYYSLKSPHSPGSQLSWRRFECLCFISQHKKQKFVFICFGGRHSFILNAGWRCYHYERWSQSCEPLHFCYNNNWCELIIDCKRQICKHGFHIGRAVSLGFSRSFVWLKIHHTDKLRTVCLSVLSSRHTVACFSSFFFQYWIFHTPNGNVFTNSVIFCFLLHIMFIYVGGNNGAFSGSILCYNWAVRFIQVSHTFIHARHLLTEELVLVSETYWFSFSWLSLIGFHVEHMRETCADCYFNQGLAALSSGLLVFDPLIYAAFGRN